MKRFTKALSMLLAIVMVVGLLPLSIIADDIQNTHTVEFKLNYNGAHKIPSQKVADGECAVQPEDVTREGWIFEYWYVKTGDGIQKFDLSQPITEDVTLYARWDEDISFWGPIWSRNILNGIAESEKEDEENEPTGKTFSVTFDVNLDNADNCPEVQVIESGKYAELPNDPQKEGYVFVGWTTEKSGDKYFDFYSTEIHHDYTLYGKWVDVRDQTDSDNDNIIDAVENYFGTSTTSNDTDSDGLSDYCEVYLVETDPLIADSDLDGILDGQEDFDEDGLVNVDEVSYGTAIYSRDTDRDGLSDADEINMHSTSPVNEDTDGDGADDGWEIENGYNPCEYNTSFSVINNCTDTISDSLTTVSVEVELSGEQADTLNITPVTHWDNHTLSPLVAGYLGCAYDITVEGDIEEATICFEYDPSLGDESDTFQPRIFYYNEITGELELLPNQTVENHKVSTKIEHFSTYILLNQVDFWDVWNDEIKKPISSSGNNNLDICFVLDVSGSMGKENRLSTAKVVLSTFLEGLEEEDRVALVKYANNATVVSDLTSDSEKIKSAINTLSANGGTATYKGIDYALDLLTKENENYGYRTIIVITDGYDEPETTYNSQYKSLVESAIDHGIMINVVGINMIDEDLMTTVAENTGGKLYMAEIIYDLQEQLDNVKTQIEEDTADINKDGLTDYYTELIFLGEISDQHGQKPLLGKNLNYDENGNLSADYDGDGLKNGQEVKIHTGAYGIYYEMVSDPRLTNTDGDPWDDYEEYMNKTDPYMYNYTYDLWTILYNDSNYSAAQYAKDFDEQFGTKLGYGFNNVFGFNWNTYKVTLAQICDYVKLTDEYSEDAESANQKMLISLLDCTIMDMEEYISDTFALLTKAGEPVYEVVSRLQSLVKLNDELIKARNTWFSLTKAGNDKLADLVWNAIKKTENLPFADKLNFKRVDWGNTKFGKIAGTLGPIFDIIDGATEILEVTEDLMTISNNYEAFEHMEELLVYLADASGRDAVRDSCDKIINILSMNEEEFSEYSRELIANETTGQGIKIGIKLLAEVHPYSKALLTVAELSNAVFDFTTKGQHQTGQLLIVDMADGCKTLIIPKVGKVNDYFISVYDNDNVDFTNKYFIQFAQLRLYGEHLGKPNAYMYSNIQYVTEANNLLLSSKIVNLFEN